MLQSKGQSLGSISLSHSTVIKKHNPKLDYACKGQAWFSLAPITFYEIKTCCNQQHIREERKPTTFKDQRTPQAGNSSVKWIQFSHIGMNGRHSLLWEQVKHCIWHTHSTLEERLSPSMHSLAHDLTSLKEKYVSVHRVIFPQYMDPLSIHHSRHFVHKLSSPSLVQCFSWCSVPSLSAGGISTPEVHQSNDSGRETVASELGQPELPQPHSSFPIPNTI